MSKEAWQGSTAANLHAEEKYLNELTSVSPDSSKHSSERSLGHPEAEFPDPGDRPLALTVERPLKHRTGSSIPRSKQSSGGISRDFPTFYRPNPMPVGARVSPDFWPEEKGNLLNLLNPILSEHSPSCAFPKTVATQEKVRK